MRKFNKLMALVLTLALCLSMAITASADETPTYPAVYITKDLKVAEGTTVPAAKFTFDFAFKRDASTGMQGDEAVTIASVDADFGNSDTATDGIVSETVQVNMDASAFPHAGVYVFEVTEDKTTFASNEEHKVTYDEAKYVMNVYVVNGTNGLEIKGATIANASGKKVVTGSETAENGFKFTNTYTRTLGTDGKAAATITNQTVGEYADMTKEFSFTLTVNKPATADDTTYTYAVVTDGVAGEKQIGTYGQAISGIKLDDDDSIEIYGVVAGSKYSVTQEPADDYKTTIEVNAAAATEVKDVLISDTAANTAVFTNTYKDVTPTGIAMNNAPFMLMIGAAGLFLLLMLVSKKRREEA